MKAVVYEKQKNTLLMNIDEPQCLNEKDVKIKVVFSGICGTDINVVRGLFPAKKGVILGHEAVGYVAAIGKDVKHIKVGQRVIIDPTFHCGYCPFCCSGKFNLCENKMGTEVGIDFNGTHAEYIVIPEKFLYPIPDEIDFEKAIFAEPLACVLNNISAASVNLQDIVVIFGAGPIGTICAMVAEKIAKQAVIVEVNSQRARYVKQHVKNVVDASNLTREEIYCEILKITENKKPSVIIDSVGSTLEVALNLIEKGGRIVLMGFNSEYKGIISTLKVTLNAIKIIGAGDYNMDIQRAVELLNIFPLEKLITHKVSLSDHDKVFNSLITGNMDKPMMKVVFQII